MGDPVSKTLHQTATQNPAKCVASLPAENVHWNCQLPDSKEWLMFSKDMEYLAICVGGLARGVRSRFMKAAHFFVTQLVELTNDLGPLLKQYGWTCAAISAHEDAVHIENRLYHSAHHAAFGEAARFLEGFRDRMCPNSQTKANFDPSIIIEEWEKVRIYILAQFSKQWKEDFGIIKKSIRRERASFALKTRILSMPPKSISPKRPRVNLKLNQIRYNGKCYDVSAECALLMHLLVEAYPNWIPASKCGFTKPSRIKDAFPPSLKALIETSPAKGYHLKLSEA